MKINKSKDIIDIDRKINKDMNKIKEKNIKCIKK